AILVQFLIAITATESGATRWFAPVFTTNPEITQGDRFAIAGQSHFLFDRVGIAVAFHCFGFNRRCGALSRHGVAVCVAVIGFFLPLDCVFATILSVEGETEFELASAGGRFISDDVEARREHRCRWINGCPRSWID